MINVEARHARPRIIHQNSSQQIEQIATKSGFAKSERHLHLLGLTNSMIGPRLSITTRMREISKGQLCLRLNTVNFSFGAHKTDIYIERKYHRSSCAYRTILAHEREHVAINDQVISDFMPVLKNELKAHANSILPRLTRNPDTAGKSMVNRLLLEMKPVIDKFRKKREAANDVIDTDQAYANTQKKCKDW
ncbi:MAG: hypothetical protein EP348_06995 [Alphaproteobacteria bacterium]|nr:MAG: hypothetical protein EP348_06995 [Alphaproteobacteria bacterium]